MFRVKQRCNLTFVERALDSPETIIVDPTSCIVITTISAIVRGSLDLSPSNRQSLLLNYSRIFLVVLDDGLLRLQSNTKAIEYFLSQQRQLAYHDNDSASVADVSWSVPRTHEELAHKVFAAISFLSPKEDSKVHFASPSALVLDSHFCYRAVQGLVRPQLDLCAFASWRSHIVFM
jgi:hypothetical protein